MRPGPESGGGGGRGGPVSWFQPMLASARVQMRLSMTRPTFRFVVIFQPLLLAVIFFHLYGRPTATGSLEYVVLGTGLASLWSAIVFSSAGDIERERWYGTLEHLVVAPGGLGPVMAGKILGNTAMGLVSMGLTWLYVRVLLGRSLPVAAPGMLALTLTVTTMSLVALSLAMCSAFTLSRNARGLMNSLEYPVFILSGLVFPLALVPWWLKPVSYVIPLTWAKLGLRTAALGEVDRGVAGLAGGAPVPAALAGGGAQGAVLWFCLMTVLTGVLYLALAWRGFRTMDGRARVRGDLGVW